MSEDYYRHRFEEEQRLRKEEQTRREEVELRLQSTQQDLQSARQALESEQLLRQALEHRVNATTFEQFLQSCHEHLSVPLAFQPKKSKSTKGSITTPKGRYCPTTLREWSDFPHERDKIFGRVSTLLHPPESLPLDVFTSLEGLKTIGELACRRPMGSELDLMSYERFAVEEQVISVVQKLVELNTDSLLPALGSGVSFENHANTLDESSDTTAQPHRGWRPRSDQLCVFRRDGESETLLFVIEYKAGHKLQREHLEKGLHPCNFWETVVQVPVIPKKDEETDKEKKRVIYNAQQLSGAAITQTFDYMIREGVEYGYLTTGESFVFLRIKEDDPTTLYYHLSYPINDVVKGSGFQFSCTAVSLVLALCLMALGSSKRDQGWRSRAFPTLHTWEVDIDQILSQIPEEKMPCTPPVSTYIPSSPLSSSGKDEPRPPRRLRNRCADSDDLRDNALSDSSDDGTKGWKWGDKRLAVVMSPPQPPPAKRQQPQPQPMYQSQEERRRNREPDRPYCTQRCLMGLASMSVLDPACPNSHLHQAHSSDGNHPISKREVARLLEDQLNDDRDNGCRPLRLHGARGIIFKMTLARYGYTFVGKGTHEGFIPDLQREAQVYEYLGKLQGNLIPVCLGSVDLREPFITDGLDLIVHYLLLSWAGDGIAPGHFDIDQDGQRLQRELRQYGVIHGDLRLANIVYSAELGKPMLIDFDRARLDTKKRKSITGFSRSKRLRLQN
ncbi:hypothetical protein LOZ58_006831 [Ophidiomyces ophidiicola]|nr:hypothetical protein LOZ58_006831 [Ophidiomyces ophidiicola]